MVFGWGKKKPEKQEAETIPQKKQITLEDIPDIIDEIRTIRAKTIIAETKTFRNKIKSSSETILHIAIDLERDTLKVDDMDVHLRRLVERGKKEVISIIKRESIVELPEINSYEDVKSFNVIAGRMLKKIGDALGRHSVPINVFAKKYASKLKDDLKSMTDRNDEITTLISNHAELETKTEQLTDTMNKIAQAKKSIINLGEEKKIDKKNIESLENQITDDQNNIESIKNSDNYQKFLQITRKLDSMSDEKNKIKNEIEEQFTKISRPLNKYVYVSSLDKPQKKLLENLIAKPYNMLIDSNRQDIIKILESTKNGVQSGSVSVKDTSKSLSQIDETLSLLDTFIEKISIFHKSKSDIENKLSALDVTELKQKESILSKHENDKSILESKIKSAKKELMDATELIPKWISSLESVLNQISAVQYTIRSK
jgi:sulfur transfer protein SufE